MFDVGGGELVADLLHDAAESVLQALGVIDVHLCDPVCHRLNHPGGIHRGGADLCQDCLLAPIAVVPFLSAELLLSSANVDGQELTDRQLSFVEQGEHKHGVDLEGGLVGGVGEIREGAGAGASGVEAVGMFEHNHNQEGHGVGFGRARVMSSTVPGQNLVTQNQRVGKAGGHSAESPGADLMALCPCPANVVAGESVKVGDCLCGLGHDQGGGGGSIGDSHSGSRWQRRWSHDVGKFSSNSHVLSKGAEEHPWLEVGRLLGKEVIEALAADYGSERGDGGDGGHPVRVNE